MKPKIIAMYLPQFHQIPENDEFWGEGFTDWVTVKNAKPLFEGHRQPRFPLNNNYYDLSIKENVEWQCKLAKEYGVYGFGIYHYWFNNEKNLLTKPAEIILENDDVDINYFFTWDNVSWKRTWSNVDGNDWAPLVDGQNKDTKGPQLLIHYILGEEKDWERHYDYVRIHFLSPKYIKKDNSPVFCIMNYSKEIERMCNYWQVLAKRDGFDGIHFVFKEYKYLNIPSNRYRFSYEPSSSGWDSTSILERINNKVKKIFHLNNHLHVFSYDKIWSDLLKKAIKLSTPEYYHGAFVSYDDTPRRGTNRGIVVDGDSPVKFERYMRELIKISESQGKEYIFLTAWNEWGEGAYLEQDTRYGDEYLLALKHAIG